jgi:phosphoribosyl-ATP pyrophosphohydrolase
MIIPSIDIRGGRAVQLVGGREQKLDGGDPLEVAERWSVAGDLAVIDLDAAMGTGDNRELIETLVRRYDCRVGGGIRSVEAALEWLEAGAEAVILGTAATEEVLEQLPADRVHAALDAAHGEIRVDGWQRSTGETVEARIEALKPYVSGFLLTFIELEGRMGGTDLSRAERLVALAAPARVTIAGGITTADEVGALDRLGADAQVGMALYTGALSVGDAVASCLRSDRPDGLWPTVVCDELGVALGLAYSDAESLREAIASRQGVYRSRGRGLWRKGEESGNTQQLLRVDADCDRDTLRFTVQQEGDGFCHRATRSCWRRDTGLGALERRLRSRLAAAPPESYTRRLLDDPELLSAKLSEEAAELAEARSVREVEWETADVAYFALTAMVRGGVSLRDVERELDRRRFRRRR